MLNVLSKNPYAEQLNVVLVSHIILISLLLDSDVACFFSDTVAESWQRIHMLTLLKEVFTSCV